MSALLKTCARWVRSNAEEYSIDKDMIISFGSSAGSQWAYLAAATNGELRFENPCGFNEYSSDINMVLLHASICDVIKDFKKNPTIEVTLGTSYEKNPEKYKEFSPACKVLYASGYYD